MTHTTDDEQQEPTGQPTWIKVLYTYGVPAAIGMYLVWNMVGSQAAVLARIDERTMEHSNAATQRAADLLDVQRRIEIYSRLVCVNTSRTDLDRTTCLTVK